MIKSKVNSVFFVLCGSLLLITLLTPFAARDLDSLAGVSTYSELASKVVTSLGSTSLGTVDDHIARSERQYEEMLEGRQWLQTQWEDPMDKSFFPCDSIPKYETMPFTIWDFYPAAFNCPHSMIRLGRPGVGGKWLCGIEKLASLPHEREAIDLQDPSSNDVARVSALTSGSRWTNPTTQPGCIIYSFGFQNNKSSFEEMLLSRTPHCTLWGYDFTASRFASPRLHENEAQGRSHFTQVGIRGKTNAKQYPPLLTVQDVMAINGHDHIDVVKMDIEGFEFDAVDVLLSHFREQGKEVPISQIVMQVHLIPDQITVGRFMKWWEKLEEAGFRPVRNEPDLLTATIPVYDGLPRYMDYTFINIKDKSSPLLK